jgi:hypothetical protein
MKQAFDSFCAKNPMAARSLLPLHYEDDRTYLSLQVADNIAFEIRKSVLATLGMVSRTRKSLERIKPNLLRIYKLDYGALKAIADANDPESLPVEPLELRLEDVLREGEL